MSYVFITFWLVSGFMILGFVFTYVVLLVPYFRNRKLPGRSGLLIRLPKHVPLIAINMVLVLSFSVIATWLFTGSFLKTGKPGLAMILIELAIIYFIDDIYQYWLHRAMHYYKPFFQKVHRVHHEARYPLPADYLYVHPVECILGSLGIAIAILLLQGIEIYTFYAYIVIKNIHQFALHSGVKSSSPFNKLFFSLNEHHEEHHSTPGFNLHYAQNFAYLDKLFGTGGKTLNKQGKMQ